MDHRFVCSFIESTQYLPGTSSSSSKLLYSDSLELALSSLLHGFSASALVGRSIAILFPIAVGLSVDGDKRACLALEINFCLRIKLKGLAK